MNLKIKQIKDKWVLFCIIGASVVGIVTYSLPIAEGDGILYLLSSISQGLAAIFALVFAITIFGAQMMRKFTAMDKMIDKWTKFLMIIFAIGILLPLIQLETNYDFLNDLFHLNFDKTENLSLAIDLGIASFCVLVIIPHLMRVNRIMKYEGGISKLREEASEAIDSNNRVTASTRINELVELGESAADDMLESYVKKIVNVLKSLLKEIVILKKMVIETQTIISIEEVANELWKDVISNTIDGLQKIGKKCAEENFDVATKEVLDALGEIAVRAATGKAYEKKLEDIKANIVDITADIVNYSMAALTQIGLVAIEHDLNNDTILSSSKGLFEIGIKVLDVSKKSKTFYHSDRIISDVIKNLEEIADKAYEKNRSKFENVYESSLVYLWILGAKINNIPEVAKDVDIASLFKKSDKSVMKEFGSEKIRMNARKSIKEEYPQLEGELKAFEGLYDASDG